MFLKHFSKIQFKNTSFKAKKTIIKGGLLFALLGLAQAGFAQQQPQYTQYIFNGLVINPAYAGSKELLQANMLHRSQWAGLEGAPTTQTLFVDGSVMQNKIGLGFQAMHDQIGAQSQFSSHLSAAVRLQLSEHGRLSFGMAGGVVQYTLDGTKLVIGAQDPSIPQSKESTILPDAKAGIFFNTQRFYAGFSAANLIKFKSDYIITPQRHFFLTSGYVFDLGESVKFKPSFLLKEDFKGPTNVDLNAFVLLYDRFWIGTSYRSGVNLLQKDFEEGVEELTLRNAWAFAAELYVTPKFRLGYAYDLSLGSLSNYAGHEVSLGYTFSKKQDTRMLSPRYF